MSNKDITPLRRRLSPVWIIPIAALAIGIYMVYYQYTSQGPSIDIIMSSAQGLKVGKTEVRYKNVSMGVLADIELSADLQQVIATFDMDRGALPLLRADSRFWLVTARVSLGSVTGLDTLLSGAYVELSPGREDATARSFTALDHPPLTPQDAPGLRLQLFSDRAGSIGTGDAVLFRGFRVGRVESTEFNPETRRINYEIFIDAPYDTLVNSAVRFWNVSGVSVTLDANGLEFNTDSLDSVILGGITFDNPSEGEPGAAVGENTAFRLHQSYKQVLENPFEHRSYFVLLFEESIKGLLPGAPVEYRGIHVGRVERIMVLESVELGWKPGSIAGGGPVSVLAYMEPGRIKLPDTPASVTMVEELMQRDVPMGLVASLQTNNLLTGAKYVGLDFDEDAVGNTIDTFAQYPVIPTVAKGFAQLEVQLGQLLTKINGLPLEETLGSTNRLVDTMNATVADLQTCRRSSTIPL